MRWRDGRQLRTLSAEVKSLRIIFKPSPGTQGSQVYGYAGEFSLREFDPTGTVNLRDPVEVTAAILLILDRRYEGVYDRALLIQCVDDLVRCYRGQ